MTPARADRANGDALKRLVPHPRRPLRDPRTAYLGRRRGVREFLRSTPTS